MRYGIFFGIFFLLNAYRAESQTPVANEMTTKFKVYGNCEMCKKRIEKAANIGGVTFADWDVDSKMLTVTFDAAKVKPSQLHKAIAAVGHDTEQERASDEVYANLPGCCQYERRQ